MPLLNRARLFANKVLAPCGFAIERVKRRNPWGRSLLATRIGRFTIQVPRTNKVSTVYQDTPGYMDELGALVSVLKKKYPDLSAIDIGANVGDTVCIMKTAADLPILCIEGDDYTFELLQQNLRQFQKVTAHKIFLGEKTGAMTATLENTGWNTTIKPGHAPDAQSIKLASFDDFIAGQPTAATCKLMKIDAEGFDCSIIRGAAGFLQRFHPALNFEYNRDNMDAIGEKGWKTLSLLRDLGYSQMTLHDCNGRFFTSITALDDVLLRDILDYADGKRGLVYYFDLTMFHKDDADVARDFINSERARRPNAQ